MITLKIAFRNIFRQKRRTLLTVLTMFGGFTLCSFSIGWMDGSYNYIIDMFTRYQLGHIQIHNRGYIDRPSLYDTIDDYESVASTVERIPGVTRTSPRLYSAGLVSVGEKSAIARIIGIDPRQENAATLFDKKIVGGQTFASPGTVAREAVIGKGLAKRIDASPGDDIVVVSQGADGSIANDVYTIAGIIETGDPAGDQTALYLELGEAQELLVLDGRIHEIAVVADDLGGVRRLASRLEDGLADPGLAVEPWQVFAKSFYDAMMADKAGGWVMLLVIVFVVAIGVLNTVLMNVLERSREYGLLRAVGTRPRQIFWLVITEVCIMAVVSAAVGCIAGWAINYGLSIKGIPMPMEFTYGGMEFSHAFTEVNTRSFVIPIVVVILSAVLVSTFPALRAARTAPAEAMRTR
ncbi:MAG: ABC transporter permease [Candidatus Latescibacterota bacterium]|nr:MAG: ABC transporter permease [Candidatus Latescibacterota bacterium]